jgi:hypothetical protein
MKILAWIGAFVVGLAAFVASIFSIMDYVLNKPAVVDTTLGELVHFYQNWIQIPLVSLIDRTLVTGSPRATPEFLPTIADAIIGTLTSAALWMLLIAMYSRWTKRLHDRR